MLTDCTEMGNEKTSVSQGKESSIFFQYNDRKKVFPNKKLLEDSHVSIKESLTAFRMKRLTNARKTSEF